MAENKKSFLMYCDFISTVEKLSDENAGKLMKHLFRYVNDQNPEPESDLIDIVFESIKTRLKRDLKEWEVKKNHKSESGVIGNLKRWNTDLYDKFIEGFIDLETAKSIAKSRKTSQPDSGQSLPIANVAVNVNVPVIASKYEGDDLVVMCMSNENWILEVERVYKVDKTKILYALNEFKSHRITIGKDEPTSLKDFKSHFTNWVRVKKQYQTKADKL